MGSSRLPDSSRVIEYMLLLKINTKFLMFCGFRCPVDPSIFQVFEGELSNMDHWVGNSGGEVLLT